MIESSAVNLSSLSIVSNELNETLQLASDAWTAFQNNPSDTTQLKATAQYLGQVNGALRLIELHGLDSLCSQLQSYLRSLAEQDKTPSDAVLSGVADLIGSIPRYLDYVRATGSSKPSLLIPALNEVRMFAGGDRIAEHSYSSFSVAGKLTLPEADADATIDTQKLSLTGRRLRQMFQTGLIAALRDNDASSHLGLMLRACERLYGLLCTRPSAERWLLTTGVLAALANDELELTRSRKRWLSTVDRAFRQSLKQLETELAQGLSDTERDELLYLLSLGSSSHPLAAIALNAVDIDNADQERVLREERAFVYGLNSDVELARLDELSGTLASVQEYLDASSRANEYTREDLEHLQKQLEQMIQSLGTSGGETLLDLLKARTEDVGRWAQQPDNVSWDALMPLADALIMLDGVLENARNLIGDTVDVVENADANTLQSAELAVISEAQAGLNLAKRAITSYVESGYDRVHLGNIATTLISVRGGLQLLHQPRAVDILQRSAQFIESAVEADLPEDSGILDTLADALISLEYYLAQLEVRHDADPSVLDVADESLTEIGFPAVAA